MHLVIVESPTKAKTIGKFLGKDYEIKASMGHLVDLPKSKLSVDTEHDFAPDFQVVEDKKQIIADLKKSAKNSTSVVLATDPDREGEAIAAHIAQLVADSSLRVDKKNNTPHATSHVPIQRIVFHEITKEAIEEALKSPRPIDQNLVNAQTARRVLDRLVGYKLSPILWQKIRRGLSAGRVQSVALRLIVEREKEIEKFKKEPYWTVMALLRQVESSKLKVESEEVEFELVEINGEKIELQSSFQLYDGEYTVTKTNIDTEGKAKTIVDNLQTGQFKVADVAQKEMHRAPLPPYTTSTLQQDASRRLGFAGKRTMRAAQKLYEEGYITYHRTDSVVIGNAALFAIRNYAKEQFGDKYIPEKPHFYKTLQKLAQEAHEAIRPTRIGELQSQISNLKSQIGGDAIKLYEMIWKRAIASQMANAVIESTTVLVDANSENSEDSERQQVRSSDNQTVRSSGSPSIPSVPKYRLKASGSVLVFDGFLKVNPQALQDKKLPQFTAGEKLTLINAKDESHETTPPPRYNDASLIKTLEEKGIGRPSTYAPIISTIEERQYIEREEARFTPTSVGVAVNDFLVAHFADIDDIPFTAEMEDHLDSVAHGKKEWVSMMEDFYKPFEEKLKSVKDAARVKIEVEQTDEKCEECGSPMVIRIGRFGKFLSCSRFPDCKFSKPFVEETKFTCPKCLPAGRQGGKVIVKKTRRGRKFFGCSNYPTCTFAAWNITQLTQQQEPKQEKQPDK